MYGVFGGVVAIMMGWLKLEVDSFAVHEGFETSEALVVEYLKYGAEATVSEIRVQVGIGL